MDQNYQPSVLISEPHIYGSNARYGGHQYAKVFAKHGWEVILLSASFNYWRLLSPDSGIEKDYLDLWKSRGRNIESNITNYTLAHLLPTQLRFREPFAQVAPNLYVPRIKSILEDHGLERVDLLWLNGAQDWLLRKVVPHSKLLVRIIDDYAGFENGFEHTHSMMRETLFEADAVFACSNKVRELYSGYYKNMFLAPNGVDFEHFTQDDAQEPQILRSIPHPRIIYVGAIADWFDFDLIIKLAQLLPRCNFVLFGSWLREKPDMINCPENVYILGSIAYDQVPSALAHSDIGIVPFKDNELVHGVSPIKVYEYLASRLPVVSLRWPALEQENLPIFLASDLNDFKEGITAGLAMTPEQKEGLRKAVRPRSWEERLARMLDYVGLGLDTKTSNLKSIPAAQL